MSSLLMKRISHYYHLHDEEPANELLASYARFVSAQGVDRVIHEPRLRFIGIDAACRS